MLTKSKIQIIKEQYAIADDYRGGLEKLMEKYNIEDSIFIHCNGMIYEATKGYFVEKSRYDNVVEAIHYWADLILESGNYMNCGIRIINNKEFVVGEVKKHLVECDKESKVFDINRLTEIR